MADWRGILQRYCGKQSLMALFVLCALPGTVFTALITPPGQSPDEVTHYARALGLMRGVLLGERRVDIDPLTGKPEWQTGFKVDAGDLGAAFGIVTIQTPYRPVVTQDDWNQTEMKPQNPSLFFINLPNTATYFPAAYVPGALGAALAKYLFNATPLHVFLTARVFMAIAFVAVGLAALWIASFGTALLFTVLVLPMTLFLAGTLNQDGLLLAMTCLAVACLTRGKRPWRVAGLVLFALVLGAKPPYIALLGVFTLPLFTPGFGRRFSDMLLAMLPVLAWVAIISLFVVVPYGKAPYHPGPLYTGDHTQIMDHANAAAQLHILLQRPQRLLALVYYSTLHFAYSDLASMIGVLGPLQILFGPWFYYRWAACLVCAAMGLLITAQPDIAPPRVALLNFILVGATVAFTYWALNIVFYLDWTNVGQPDIDGIQGRYLLTFLPFLLYAIPNLQSFSGLRRHSFAWPELLPALPAAGMALFDLFYVPVQLVQNYYLH